MAQSDGGSGCHKTVKQQNLVSLTRLVTIEASVLTPDGDFLAKRPNWTLLAAIIREAVGRAEEPVSCCPNSSPTRHVEQFEQKANFPPGQ